MKVIKDRHLTEAPRDGAVSFKLPKSAMFDPKSLDLKGWGAQAKADADRKAEEEARAKAYAENKAKYSDLITRAQAAEEPEKMLEVLFEELVPSSGKADTVAGELVRAMMRLLYRDYNDGDLFYEGYGIETCGGSVAYLISEIDSLYDKFEEIANHNLEDDRYTDALDGICNDVLNFIYTNDSVWQPNEEDSRSRQWDKEYESSYQSDWEPIYDYDFQIPPTIREHIDAGHITTYEFMDRVRDALDGNWNIKYGSVEDCWGDCVKITDLNKGSYDELRDWRMWEDDFWSDYIEELNDEYGDPWDEDDDDEDEDEDINESLKLRESTSPMFTKGQKVMYNGKVTTVMDVEFDPEYGPDYLVVNPDYDGTDSRYEYIWVADKVDPVN